MKGGIWLGGEGSNDIGGLRAEPPWQEAGSHGVLHALLDLAAPGASDRVRGGTQWPRIPKYSTRRSMPPEVKNVRGLVLCASEKRCDVVAFVRDMDGDPQRRRDVMAGIEIARQEHPDVAVVGGMPDHCLEAWVLAAAGVARTSGMSRPRAAQQLGAVDIAPKDTAAYVGAVRAASVSTIAPDAADLHAWLRQAGEVLSVP